MIYGFLAAAVLTVFIGLSTIAGLQSLTVVPPHSALLQQAEGSQFVVYRNAVLTYMTANPTYTGSVPASSLVLPAGFPPLPGQGNQVVVLPSGKGRMIYAYATLPAAAASQAASATDGDISYGVVSGTSWASPIAGAMGALGVSVPDGNVVSVFQIGN